MAAVLLVLLAGCTPQSSAADDECVEAQRIWDEAGDDMKAVGEELKQTDNYTPANRREQRALMQDEVILSRRMLNVTEMHPDCFETNRRVATAELVDRMEARLSNMQDD